MAKSYDNLEDVKSKLLGTIVMYDGVPCHIKQVYTAADYGNDEHEYWLATSNLGGRLVITRGLTDPLFNFTKFNIGYANYKSAAVWWYRLPYKQYRQGLKADQFRYHASEKAAALGIFSFGTGKDIDQMLKAEYPGFEEVEKTIKSQENGGLPIVQAFHKNFALSHDRIHDDMILEYKGQLIGNIIDRKTFKLLSEYSHLNEVVQETLANAA